MNFSLPAVASDALYFAREGYAHDAGFGIGRTGLDGGNADVVIDKAVDALAADAAHVHSAAYDATQPADAQNYPIRVSGPTRTDPTTLVPGDGYRKSGMAVDGCRIYWADARNASSVGPPTNGAIASTKLDGTSGAVLVSGSQLSTPEGVAVDQLGPAGNAACAPTATPPTLRRSRRP